jgi:hypothetical protein
MEVINQYISFYIGELLYSIKEKIDITNFITQSFPSSFLMKIKIKNDFIIFDLEGNFYDTEVKGLTWRNFSNEYLLEIKKLLNVEVREIVNTDNKDNLIVFYEGKTLNIALKTFNNKIRLFSQLFKNIIQTIHVLFHKFYSYKFIIFNILGRKL